MRLSSRIRKQTTVQSKAQKTFRQRAGGFHTSFLWRRALEPNQLLAKILAVLHSNKSVRGQFNPNGDTFARKTPACTAREGEIRAATYGERKASRESVQSGFTNQDPPQVPKSNIRLAKAVGECDGNNSDYTPEVPEVPNTLGRLRAAPARPKRRSSISNGRNLLIEARPLRPRA